jgi:hypothetical protein
MTTNCRKFKLSARSLSVLKILQQVKATPQEPFLVSWLALQRLSGLSSFDLLYGLWKLRFANLLSYRLYFGKLIHISVGLIVNFPPTYEGPEDIVFYEVGESASANIYITTTTANETTKVLPTAKGAESKRGLGGEGEEGNKDGQNFTKRLAKALGEEKRERFYENLVCNYGQEIAERALDLCLQVPDMQIRKSRAALYQSILKRLYDEQRKSKT